ncbi:toprim domain-containing protein [Leptospira sp. 96542]|nr:toprim domain-containing protein [Leptospira sp. 96542]
MADLLQEIAERLKQDYGFKLKAGGKYLQQGMCPSCKKKSLWTWADSPWVVKCERSNNCGQEWHVKELYPDLFESWSDRFQKPEAAKPVEQQNPNAAADAYLRLGRGFSDPAIMALLKGSYSQEHHFDREADHGRGAGSATVRFKVAETWWERLIDQPARFGKKKAVFKPGGTYSGMWWAMPGLTFTAPAPTPVPDAATAMADAMQRAEQAAAPAPAPTVATPAFLVTPVDLWLVEGIFDAIALAHHGIPAVALLSCNNYPEQALAELDAHIQRQGGQVKKPRLIWALDGDKAGQDYTRRHVRRAQAAGWVCTAAQIPQGRGKVDWNDLHQRQRLDVEHVKTYLYHGALLIASTAQDKALLIYNHTSKAEFDLVHDSRLYWFSLNLERYRKAADQLEKDIEAGHRQHLSDDEKRAHALKESGVLRPIANCAFQALYYQRNDVTDESWYYFRITFPHDGAAVKNTFTAGQISAASEFKKRLLETAPGAVFSGDSFHLQVMLERQLYAIKTVATVDFVGYSAQHKAYLLGKVAVHGGRVVEQNSEDYFEIDRLHIKSLQRSVKLHISDETATAGKWFHHLWSAFGPKGYVALAFWFGALFAEQIRAAQQSFPFLEIVGVPGAGKTTLIHFLWKLVGRPDYEGFDPSKSTSAGRMRTFTQVSNLPVVLIESDRETKTGNQAHIKSFDWDELKDAYNGNSIRTTGVKTGGNETYEPPFRAAFVISQNNQVQASQAIMERICHMTFTTDGFTRESFESAKALERFEVEQVSGFVLAALQREAQVLEHVTTQHEARTELLLQQDGIVKPRIAKNHAQILVLAEALHAVLNAQGVRLDRDQFALVREQIFAMARERQESIGADHPLVQEFWELFEFLDRMPVERGNGTIDTAPRLNHHHEPLKAIAVNLNEFVEHAKRHNQQVPLMSELKKALRTSKSRRFIEIKSVNSAIDRKAAGDTERGRTVYCWVFERPGKSTK